MINKSKDSVRVWYSIMITGLKRCSETSKIKSPHYITSIFFLKPNCVQLPFNNKYEQNRSFLMIKQKKKIEKKETMYRIAKSKIP